MKFSLISFTQEMGFRVFTFTRFAEGLGRAEVTVRADLALMRRCAIRIQELPLLCQVLLERDLAGDTRDFTLTEEEMRIYSQKNRPSKPAYPKRSPGWATPAEGRS